MDAWLQSLLTAIVSGLVVGLVVAVFKVKLDQNVKTAEKANDLRIDNVMNELGRVWSKVSGVENKMDTIGNNLGSQIGSLNMKMAVVIAEHQHIAKNLDGLQDEFRSFRKNPQPNYGQVVQKP